MEVSGRSIFRRVVDTAAERRYKEQDANEPFSERGSEMTAPPDDFAFRAPAGVPGGSERSFPNRAGVWSLLDELPGS